MRNRLRAAAGGGAPPPTFPLDGFPTAPTFAYSLNRRLLTSYSNDRLFRVRETGTNTGQDVLMVSNQVDASGIPAFGGASVTKMISTIYNQGSVGAAGDAVGAAAAQHQIYNGPLALLRRRGGGTTGRLALDGVGTGGYAIGTHNSASFISGADGATVQAAFVGVFSARNFRDMFLIVGADNNISIHAMTAGNTLPYGNLAGSFPGGNMWNGELPTQPASANAGYRQGANGEFRRSGGAAIGTPQRTDMSGLSLAASQTYTLLGAAGVGFGGAEVDEWCEFAWFNYKPADALLNGYISSAIAYYTV